MILTKQMVRDKIINGGPISVSGLAYSFFKDETVSMQHFNTIMMHVIELEHDKIVRYNVEKGCYETDMIFN